MSANQAICWLLIGCWLPPLTSLAAAEWIDLSHTFNSTAQYWPGALPFNLTATFKGQKEFYWYEANDFEAAEHGGTHMDAPSHFWKGGWSLDQIPADRFVAHAALIDIEDRSQKDPDSILTPDDLAKWKSQYGSFKHPTILLVRTGNAKYWSDSARYFGFQNGTTIDTESNETSAPELHFPGIGAEAGRFLADDPAIVGVGIDTPSIDAGNSKTFPTHVTLFAANKFGVENVGDMSRVPATGATILALPMKIGGGSGGPCRVLVRLP
ncbi:isatin hydrolase-like isoform X1 [Amphibalanus amphitrite]|uniref:isatin hydrolase-like isoform X1 n=1 Tax=Amphibalanus amphitrite TaxID=1232801 RepID=UPI001C8FE51D|nr:isatin hydrolase-like isoform X1 [Amphibalanus amphitrite]XP_043208123.1 isatin hydrolase-like isoform X1 [Amphibalanus amphitrite]XP_043208127.1 isatin hydrolase-like isoform X1 [Amphibalanus amphitrite]